MTGADDRRSEASEAFERRYLEHISSPRLVELLAEYEPEELIDLLAGRSSGVESGERVL